MDFKVLVSFFRILNGLSDEINLFRRCSSPLIDICLFPSPFLALKIYCFSTFSLSENRKFWLIRVFSPVEREFGLKERGSINPWFG